MKSQPTLIAIFLLFFFNNEVHVNCDSMLGSLTEIDPKTANIIDDRIKQWNITKVEEQIVSGKLYNYRIDGPFYYCYLSIHVQPWEENQKMLKNCTCFGKNGTYLNNMTNVTIEILAYLLKQRLKEFNKSASFPKLMNICTLLV
ncbi:hypothetical protein GJ496_006075 [Pomphorhynchus laevis]|nr:hypothetical protein GJ496_006075 [Pomphorhynchus laevis]